MYGTSITQDPLNLQYERRTSELTPANVAIIQAAKRPRPNKDDVTTTIPYTNDAASKQPLLGTSELCIPPPTITAASLIDNTRKNNKALETAKAKGESVPIISERHNLIDGKKFAYWENHAKLNFIAKYADADPNHYLTPDKTFLHSIQPAGKCFVYCHDKKADSFLAAYPSS